MTPPSWTALELFQGPEARPVGRLELQEGRLHVEVADPVLAAKVRALAEQPGTWPADDGDPAVERSILREARPGTPEHLRFLMFQVRSLGLEARLRAPAD